MSGVFHYGMTVAKTGVSQASGAASAGTTLPTVSSSSNTDVPKYIRVAATAAAYFRIGAGAQTCVAGDLLVQPGDAVVMAVPSGYTNFACLQVSVAGVVVVTPLENM
jgi:hypothetical protein